MQDSIATLRQEWQALQLELLTPAKLADEDFASILAVRSDPHNSAYRERLPMVVAHFKETAKRDIMREAQSLSNVQSSRYEKAYREGIAAINDVLFGKMRLFLSTSRVGLFTEAQDPRLHDDGFEHNKTGHSDPLYVARVADEEIVDDDLRKDMRLVPLPTFYISVKDAREASDEVRQLMSLAKRITGEDARDSLRERGILAPLPVGAVALIATFSSEHEGTPHCSSPVPPEGAYSAFFSAVFHGAKTKPSEADPTPKIRQTPRPSFLQKLFTRLP